MDKHTALLIIDVQNAFNDPKWGERNNVQAEANIFRLLERWRQNEWKVIHIKHISDNPDSLFYPEKDSFEVKEGLQPLENEIIFTKKVNSAFIGTDLECHLRENEISNLIITGLTTPHCVSTTTRMSQNLGFNNVLVSDATAAFGITDATGKYYDAATIHDISLATLHEEFATIKETNDLIEE